LIAGMYVSALIEKGKQLVMAVPKDVIVKANDKSYIFVFERIEKEPVKRDESDSEANKNEFQQTHHFKMIEVVTGAEELGYVEIKLVEESKPNTKIVTKGAFYLYSSMQSIETDAIE
jgi:membrane fusion protein, heavy metal efflux system